MGSGRYSASDWDTYKSTTASKSREELFSTSLVDDLDPVKIALRESRYSGANPNATPVIVACDVTGSMGHLAEHLIRKGIGVVFSEVIDRKPVADPHLMCMAVGDFWNDRAPLQVTQFETEASVIGKQVEKIFIEGGGGGNTYESYNGPWFFAATKTSIDCFEKDQRKGYLFTVGDEECPPVLEAAHIARFLNGGAQTDMPSRDVLAMAERMYHCFHVVIEEGDYARRNRSAVMKSWTNILGQRVIPLADHNHLSEVIVSAIQVNEGADHDAVADSWGGGTSLVVASAVKGLVKGAATTPAAKGDTSGVAVL